jgi:hypothetical protein
LGGFFAFPALVDFFFHLRDGGFRSFFRFSLLFLRLCFVRFPHFLCFGELLFQAARIARLFFRMV